MDNTLKKLAIAVGLALLGISMFWSQDGFNFDLAGDSGGGNVAVFVGWTLAVSVTVVQFVFSTNFNKLNASLIIFGILAYVYSIYTNAHGIMHFQGENANKFGAWILGLVMDGVPEPLIAWGLGESLTGDFVGNILKSLSSQTGRNNSSGNSKNFTQSKYMSQRPTTSSTSTQTAIQPQRNFKKYAPQSPVNTVKSKHPGFGRDIQSFLQEHRDE